jgi:hypothetical protein
MLSLSSLFFSLKDEELSQLIKTSNYNLEEFLEAIKDKYASKIKRIGELLEKRSDEIIKKAKNHDNLFITYLPSNKEYSIVNRDSVSLAYKKLVEKTNNNPLLIVYSEWLEEDGLYYVVRFRKRNAFNFVYNRIPFLFKSSLKGKRNACGMTINEKITGDKENLEKILVKWFK